MASPTQLRQHMKQDGRDLPYGCGVGTAEIVQGHANFAVGISSTR